MMHLYELQKTTDPAVTTEDYSYELSNRMYLTVDQEYFYLRGTDIYDMLAELVIDISNEVTTTLQQYIVNPEQLEEQFDKLSGIAGQYMQKLNTIVAQNVPKE